MQEFDGVDYKEDNDDPTSILISIDMALGFIMAVGYGPLFGLLCSLGFFLGIWGLIIIYEQYFKE